MDEVGIKGEKGKLGKIAIQNDSPIFHVLEINYVKTSQMCSKRWIFS